VKSFVLVISGCHNTSYISTLPPSILAKSLKEVNEILKFFKKKSPPEPKKLYAQASSKQNTLEIARKTLRIKDAFSNLQNKKIELVQKIMSGDQKPKLCINITTKEPSHKQVIILMNKKNAINFVKDSSNHITNINRNLKNIKLDVMANFTHIKNKEVVIIINKIASNLDLQTIEKYIKNVQSIEADHIEFPRLSQSKFYLKIISIPYLLEQTNV